MLVEVNDKKVREYLKSMYLDFKLSPIKTEESEFMRVTLRKVVNNNKINLISGGFIFDYVSKQLENSRSYYLEKHMSMRNDLSYSQHLETIEEVYQEWEYLFEWLNQIFSIENNLGLKTIQFQEIV